MAQIYNAGNDFVAAFSEGARQRMAREQLKAQQLQQIEDNKFKGEQLKLEHARLDQESAAQQAQIAAHFEGVKHQRMADIASGLIKVDPNDPNTQMNPDAPGAKNVQIGALDQLNNLPPQLRDHIMAAFSGQQQQPDYNYDVNAAVNPQPSPLAANPSLFTQQQAPQPPASSLTETQPDPQTFSPSSTQYSDIDPRLNNGNPYMKLTGLTTPEDQQKLSMQQMLVKAKMDALTEGMKANAKLPAEKALEEAKNTGALKVQDSKNQNATSLEATRAQTQKEISEANRKNEILKTNLTVAGQQSVAKMRAASAMAVAEFKSAHPNATNQISPDEVEASLHSIATGDAVMPSLTTARGQAINKAAVNSGIVPFTAKDRDKLNSIHDIDGILTFIQTQIKDAPTNMIGAWQNNMLSKINATDANEAYNVVWGRGANMSHTIGGEISRLSDPDIVRAMKIASTTGITRDQMIARIDRLKADKQTKVLNLVRGQKPLQMLMNLERNGFDPAEVGGSAMKNGKALMLPNGNPMPKFAQKDNSWWAYNEKTGQYDQVK